MRLILGFIVSLFVSNVLATHKALELIINTPYTTPTNDKVYLTGNIPGLCFWISDCLELEKIAPNTYRTFINFPLKQQSFEFKITRGSWETQAAYSNGMMGNNIYIELEIESLEDVQREVYTVKNWLDHGAYKVKGELLRYPRFYSPQLQNKRMVSVWLPPSYRRDSLKRYPVIYMHDGQNVFDINTSSFGNEWNIDEVMIDLIQKGEIPEAIIVASDSTNKRNAEYSDNRKGQEYGRFLVESLKPFIDHEFRTMRNKENTFLMGSSMGALISFSVLWRHPETFSKAAGLSFPAFAYDNMIINFLDEFESAPMNTSFYLDHGGIGQDQTYFDSVELFTKKVINQLGLPKNQIQYHVFPFADHTEPDWARRVYLPLKFLLND